MARQSTKEKEKPAAVSKIEPDKKPVAGDSPASQVDTRAQQTVETHRTRKRQTKDEIAAEAYDKGRAAAEAERNAQIYSPENWLQVVRLPADVMLAVSGRELWKLPDDETKQLAVNASTVAQYFGSAHPKWFALAILGLGLITTYGTRAVVHIMEVREERRAAYEAAVMGKKDS